MSDTYKAMTKNIDYLFESSDYTKSQVVQEIKQLIDSIISQYCVSEPVIVRKQLMGYEFGYSMGKMIRIFDMKHFFENPEIYIQILMTTR